VAFDEGLAERVREALAAIPVSEKRMFGGLAFMLHGNMCCGVVGDSLMIRVPADEHETILEEPDVRPFDMTGRPMKGWVVVSEDGIAEDEQLRAWVERSVAFASLLPPK
jgi:hypothetical protein